MMWPKTPLALALLALAAAPAADPPTVLERLGWNARERTAAGRSLLDDRRPDPAADAFDAALRLRPEDPRVRFNAGTARLLAGRADAADVLEEAAGNAPAELASDAWFNLGNARLAGSDPAGAAAAYRQSLRLSPSRGDAKRNLELALRARVPERPSPDGAPAPPPAADRAAEAGAGGVEDPDRDSPEGSPEEHSGNGASDPRAPGGDPQRPARDDPAQPSSESPDDPAPAAGLRFDPVPEMTAEQAEALLRAVEALEREQRRRRALERNPAGGEADEDW